MEWRNPLLRPCPSFKGREPRQGSAATAPLFWGSFCFDGFGKTPPMAKLVNQTRRMTPKESLKQVDQTVDRMVDRWLTDG
jgi:hypothetical protein